MPLIIYSVYNVNFIHVLFFFIYLNCHKHINNDVNVDIEKGKEVQFLFLLCFVSYRNTFGPLA